MHTAVFTAAIALLMTTSAGATQNPMETESPEGPKVSVFRERPCAQDKIQCRITPGMRAAKIRTNAALGAAGFVLPDDRVDIMLSRNEESGRSEPQTHILLQDIRVLAVDQEVESETERVVVSVTVEVTADQVPKLVLAQRVGSLSLVLRKSEPPAPPGERRLLHYLHRP